MQLFRDKIHRTFRFQPAEQRPGVNIPRLRGYHRDLAHAENTIGVIPANITVQAAGAGRRSDQPDLPGSFSGYYPDIFQPGHDRRGAPEQLDGVLQVGASSIQADQQIIGLAFPARKRYSTGAHDPPAEPAAAYDSGHVEKITAYPPAKRGSRKIPDIAGNSPEISGMISEALKLQGDAAHHLGMGRDTSPGKGFDGHAVSLAMTDAGVPGNCFHLVHGLRVRSADQGLFNAAVLETEGDLQAEDLFAMALETEMPRLDDPGVHRPHRHLVNLIPLDPVVRHDSRQEPVAVKVVPKGAFLAEGSVEPDRLNPRVPLRRKEALFGDLPLKKVQLRAIRCKRREGIGDFCPGNSDASVGLGGENTKQLGATVARYPEVGRDTPAALYRIKYPLKEVITAGRRKPGKRYR